MDPSKNYDNLLLPILNSEGKIEGFLDAIFEFLYRRTDFFNVWGAGDDRTMGFPPGAAEKLVKAAFVRYMKKSLPDVVEVLQPCDEEVPLDYIAEEVEVSEVDDYTDNDDAKQDKSIMTLNDVESSDSSQLTNQESNADKVYTSDCESYNGASYDKYSWSQNLKDVDLLVKIPPNGVTGQRVDVSIASDHIKVRVQDDGEWQEIIDGDFTNKINIEESVWTLVPREHIHVCLHKVKEKWWDACFVNEPKIDVRAIDASQPFEDLDEESQAKIQELMYKEHMKRLGKPVTQHSKAHKILREAWDKENSPFRGQPFDPSLINFSNSEDIP